MLEPSFSYRQACTDALLSLLGPIVVIIYLVTVLVVMVFCFTASLAFFLWVLHFLFNSVAVSGVLFMLSLFFCIPVSMALTLYIALRFWEKTGDWVF